MPRGKAKKPPVSQAQHRLMRAAAADAHVAKATGVSTAVAQEFVRGAHGKNVGKLPEKVTKKGQKG